MKAKSAIASSDELCMHVHLSWRASQRVWSIRLGTSYYVCAVLLLSFMLNDQLQGPHLGTSFLWVPRGLRSSLHPYLPLAAKIAHF